MNLETQFTSSRIPSKIDAPSLSDLHYRFSKLDEELLEELFRKLLEEYKQRYFFIEQVIGKIKNAYGMLEKTKSYEMARKYIWAKMILYNWAMIFLTYWLVRMRFVFGAYHHLPGIFRTHSHPIVRLRDSRFQRRKRDDSKPLARAYRKDGVDIT